MVAHTALNRVAQVRTLYAPHGRCNKQEQTITNHNKTDETGGGKPLFSYNLARRGVKHADGHLP